MRNPLRVKKGSAVLKRLRLGDAVHAVALPVARALNMPCVDPETKQLRPESNCAKRRKKWNGEA
jgi:hypothetical protein